MNDKNCIKEAVAEGKNMTRPSHAKGENKFLLFWNFTKF